MYTQGYSFGTMRCLGSILVMLPVFFWKVLSSTPSVDHFICYMHATDNYQINSLVLFLELM